MKLGNLNDQMYVIPTNHNIAYLSIIIIRSVSKNLEVIPFKLQRLKAIKTWLNIRSFNLVIDA